MICWFVVYFEVLINLFLITEEILPCSPSLKNNGCYFSLMMVKFKFGVAILGLRKSIWFILKKRLQMVPWSDIKSSSPRTAWRLIWLDVLVLCEVFLDVNHLSTHAKTCRNTSVVVIWSKNAFIFVIFLVWGWRFD